MRLTHGPDRHGDLEYRYEITAAGKVLQVTVFSVGQQNESRLFEGSLEAMRAWAKSANA